MLIKNNLGMFSKQSKLGTFREPKAYCRLKPWLPVTLERSRSRDFQTQFNKSQWTKFFAGMYRMCQCIRVRGASCSRPPPFWEILPCLRLHLYLYVQHTSK